MLKLTTISAQSAADDEVAAIVAAVHAFECCKRKQQAMMLLKATKKQQSWKLAGLLENTGRAAKVTAPLSREILSSPWKSNRLSQLVLLLPAIFWVFSSAVSPAAAQSPNGRLAPDMMTDNYGIPPQPAPPFQTAKPGAASTYNDLSESAIIERGQQGSYESARQNSIRVALALNTTLADIDLPDGAILRNATTGDTLAELPPQSRWHVDVKNNGGSSQICFQGKIESIANGPVKVASRSQYRSVAFVSGAVPRSANLLPLPSGLQPQFSLPYANEMAVTTCAYVLIPPAEGTFALAGKLYRGNLLISAKAPKAQAPDSDNNIARARTSVTNSPAINLINQLELEDYLLSVVPSEMPSGWPLEALKAQAITARSFAMARLGRYESDGYDVKATIEDQVYTGVTAESVNSNRAVAETSGLVLKHGGKIVTAFFHSASGGFTEVSENVWSKPVPYLKAVPDFDDESPHFSWTRSFNIAQAESVLNQSGRSLGSLLALIPVSRGISPRVRWLMAVGTEKTMFISGEFARKVFSLPSSSFNVSGTDGNYFFAGRGFGHGLGMSQWGAKKLAEAGYGFDHILSYYYKDITIDRI